MSERGERLMILAYVEGAEHGLTLEYPGRCRGLYKLGIASGLMDAYMNAYGAEGDWIDAYLSRSNRCLRDYITLGAL